MTSDPPGAAFQLGEHTGRTPATILIEPSRHRIEFRSGLAGYLAAHLEVLPKNQTYPSSLHVVFAKDGEGITTINVGRDAPKPVPIERGTKNQPLYDDGKTYWLK